MVENDSPSDPEVAGPDVVAEMAVNVLSTDFLRLLCLSRSGRCLLAFFALIGIDAGPFVKCLVLVFHTLMRWFWCSGVHILYVLEHLWSFLVSVFAVSLEKIMVVGIVAITIYGPSPALVNTLIFWVFVRITICNPFASIWMGILATQIPTAYAGGVSHVILGVLVVLVVVCLALVLLCIFHGRIITWFQSWVFYFVDKALLAAKKFVTFIKQRRTIIFCSIFLSLFKTAMPMPCFETTADLTDFIAFQQANLLPPPIFFENVPSVQYCTAASSSPVLKSQRRSVLARRQRKLNALAIRFHIRFQHNNATTAANVTIFNRVCGKTIQYEKNVDRAWANITLIVLYYETFVFLAAAPRNVSRQTNFLVSGTCHFSCEL